MGDNGPTAGRVGGTAYIRAGAGRPVVFVHGVGMNAGFWQPQIAAFARVRTVVAYDMLGHGGSALPPPSATLGDYTAQLLELMDGLGLERAAVVGHSMGVLVVLDFALTHPGRVERVAALNGVYRRSAAQRAAVMARAENLAGGADEEGRRATLARWFGDPIPPGLHETAAWVDQALGSVDPVGYARTYQLFAASDEAHVGRLPALAVPALFLTGELDPNSSPEMSRAMAAEAPRGRVVALPGERHMMSLASPTAVNAELAAFLEIELGPKT